MDRPEKISRRDCRIVKPLKKTLASVLRRSSVYVKVDKKDACGRVSDLRSSSDLRS